MLVRTNYPSVYKINRYTKVEATANNDNENDYLQNPTCYSFVVLSLLQSI